MSLRSRVCIIRLFTDVINGTAHIYILEILAKKSYNIGPSGLQYKHISIINDNSGSSVSNAPKIVASITIVTDNIWKGQG
jgi:hypothetical protein